MNLRRVAAVARREYAETVKTKAFVLGILLMPGLIIAMVFISTRMTVRSAQAPGTIRVAVIDHTHRLAGEMKSIADARGGGTDQAVEIAVVKPEEVGPDALGTFKPRLLSGALFAAVEVPADAIDGNGTCMLHLSGSGMDERPRRVERLIQDAARRIRFSDAGIDAGRVDELSRPVGIARQGVRESRPHQREDVTRMLTPFAFTLLSFMGIFGVGQGLLTSVIEEKSSRVVEVLLSALSPSELMAGKIVGVAGVGLTMVSIWSGAGYAAAAWKDATHLVRPAHPEQFVIYYLLGFLLISGLLAAIGSACNTLKEAQPMMAPLTMLLVVPMMFWFNIVNSPNAALATSLSLVPPMTPFIMMLRLASTAGDVPVWQQVVVPIWLALWVLITIWVAGRVFRVGLLMYGKPPGLRELARWVSYS